MVPIPLDRFQTGEECLETGWYEFDGYLDGSSGELPGLDEMEVSLSAGQSFPAIQSLKRPCFWKLASGMGSADDAAAGVLPFDE